MFNLIINMILCIYYSLIKAKLELRKGILLILMVFAEETVFDKVYLSFYNKSNKLSVI